MMSRSLHRQFAPLTVLVNTRGSGPTLRLEDLGHDARRRYAAQLDAWRAGVKLARSSYLNAAYGIPVPHADVDAWEGARDWYELESTGRTG